MGSVLPSGLTQGVGAPNSAFSRLHTQPIPALANACHNPSRGNSHDSGASVARYAFTAKDFHFQLLTGLSRRFGQTHLIMRKGGFSLVVCFLFFLSGFVFCRSDGALLSCAVDDFISVFFGKPAE